jgi:hypothetical protein
MKNSKNLLPLFAILLGLGLVFTQSAFKPAKKSATTVMYQYEDTNDARINLEDAWTDVTFETPESCSEGAVLPCVIEFDTTEFATLGAYLAAHPTAQAIKDDPNNVVSKKDGVIIEP